MKHRFLFLILALIGVGVLNHSPKAFAQSLSPSAEDPSLAWAKTYLLNSAFALEYLAVIGDGSIIKQKSPFLNDASGQRLWKRGLFGMAAAKNRSQLIGETETIQRYLASQLDLLKKSKSPPKDLIKTIKDFKDSKGIESNLFKSMPEAFSGHPHAQAFIKFQASYQTPQPTCPLSSEEVNVFAANQLSRSSNNKTMNPHEIIQPVQTWQVDKLRCLIFALMATTEDVKKSQGYDPLPLMMALRQTESNGGKDPAVKTMLALRLLQLQNFSEALRVTSELMENNDAYRLPYETIQRIFAFKQKGKGEVALQSL